MFAIFFYHFHVKIDLIKNQTKPYINDHLQNLQTLWLRSKFVIIAYSKKKIFACCFVFAFFYHFFTLKSSLHKCIGAKILLVLRKVIMVYWFSPLSCCLLKLPFLSQPSGTVAWITNNCLEPDLESTSVFLTRDKRRRIWYMIS